MLGRPATTTVTALAVAALAVPADAGATSSFADLPDPVYVDIGIAPFDVFDPIDFDFGGGHVVTATLDESAMSCPDNIGVHGEPVTHPSDPLVDPGDAQGRFVENIDTCPDQNITLDFSEPVRAVGVSFKHYSCGFLQQGDRTIQAFDGPGGTGTLIGTASTQGYAIACFAIWIDFVGVVSAQDDIQSMVILSDSQPTLFTGLAASAGAPPVECAADLDGDTSVGVTDLLALLAVWGPCAGCPEDLDGDAQVGVTDLLQLLADWGQCG